MMASAARNIRWLDREIRPRLRRWLTDMHSGEATAIIDELAIPRPSARIDMAVVNGRLEGFEIKSASDSLERLDRQIESFGKIFERMHLVTTLERYPEIRHKIPKCWGIVVIEADSEFRVARKSRSNSSVNVENALFVLGKAELIELESIVGSNLGPISRTKGEIVQDIVRKVGSRRIYTSLKTILKQRDPNIR